MVAVLSEKAPAGRPQASTWQGLPPRMRVLYIATRQRTGGWLAEAFAADSASQVVLEEAVGTAAGLARLRDEVFDAVLVSHEPAELDALDLIEGYRAGGGRRADRRAGHAERAGDGRPVLRGRRRRLRLRPHDHHAEPDLGRRPGRAAAPTGPREPALALAEQTRLQREHDEAACVLQQQRALLARAGAAGHGEPDDAVAVHACRPN